MHSLRSTGPLYLRVPSKVPGIHDEHAGESYHFLLIATSHSSTTFYAISYSLSLIDSGANESFMDWRLAKRLELK